MKSFVIAALLALISCHAMAEDAEPFRNEKFVELVQKAVTAVNEDIAAFAPLNRTIDMNGNRRNYSDPSVYFEAVQALGVDSDVCLRCTETYLKRAKLSLEEIQAYIKVINTTAPGKPYNESALDVWKMFGGYSKDNPIRAERTITTPLKTKVALSNLVIYSRKMHGYSQVLDVSTLRQWPHQKPK